MDRSATAAVCWIGTVPEDESDKPDGVYVSEASVDEGRSFSASKVSALLSTGGASSSDLGNLSMRMVGEISSTNFSPFRKRFNKS